MGTPSSKARAKAPPIPEPEDSPTLELGRIFKSLCDDRKYTAASDLLDAFQAKNKVEERIAIHYRAQLLTLQGRWSDALSHLEKLQITHGAHLRVLSDIGRCRYMTGDLTGWRATVQQLEQTFAALRDQVSLDTYARTAVTLAFFLEEEGRLGSALDMCDELLRKTKRPEHMGFRIPALIRSVRLQSLAGGLVNLDRTQAELRRLSGKDAGQQHFVEVQHALILSETVLKGWEKGCSLLLDVLIQNQLPESDRRLLYFDFIDLASVHGSTGDAGVPLNLTPYPDDPFEYALTEALAADAGFQMGKLDQWVVGLPYAGFLRVLTHLTRRLGDGPGQTVRDQFDLLLKVLDPRSQAMWKSRLKRGK